MSVCALMHRRGCQLYTGDVLKERRLAIYDVILTASVTMFLSLTLTCLYHIKESQEQCYLNNRQAGYALYIKS